MYRLHLYVQAVKHNLVYPNYGWITWYRKNWWAGNFSYHCTKEEIKGFLQQSWTLSIKFHLEPDDSDIPTAAGFVRHILQYNIFIYSHNYIGTLPNNCKTVNCESQYIYTVVDPGFIKGEH